MTVRILILDYGVGNLFSLSCAISAEGGTPVVRSELSVDEPPEGLVLPGVGNFQPVAATLSHHRDQLTTMVRNGLPVLGVCLGMQMLFDGSDEGTGEGLGLIPGHVVRLPPTVKVPHMGWNTLDIAQRHPLTDGITDGDWVYFVHSYYPNPEDSGVVVGRAKHGVSFPAIVAHGNVFGTQFHPEKSGEAGRILLRNFLRLCRM